MLYLVSELSEGLSVESMDCYFDGTIWGVLVDEGVRKAFVGIDGRITSPTRYRLYEKAKHPKSDRAVFIDRGAWEEGLVIRLLARWVDSPESEIYSLEFKSRLREVLHQVEDSGLHRVEHDENPQRVAADRNPSYEDAVDRSAWRRLRTSSVSVTCFNGWNCDEKT